MPSVDSAMKTLVTISLVLWGMLGQLCGGFLWLWLLDIDHRSVGWQWVIGITGLIPFWLGGLIFILIAAGIVRLYESLGRHRLAR